MRAFVYALFVVFFASVGIRAEAAPCVPFSPAEKMAIGQALRSVAPYAVELRTEAVNDALAVYYTACADEVIHNPHGYVITVAKRKLLNKIRDEGVRARAELAAASEPGSWLFPRDADIRGRPSHSTSDIIMGRRWDRDTQDLTDLMGAALAGQLNPEGLERLYRKYNEGLTLPQIARAEGVKLTTAQSRMRTAENALKDVVQEAKPMLADHGWFGRDFWDATAALGDVIVTALILAALAAVAVVAGAIAMGALFFLVAIIGDVLGFGAYTSTNTTPARQGTSRQEQEKVSPQRYAYAH